jgi:hypothetical protein
MHKRAQQKSRMTPPNLIFALRNDWVEACDTLASSESPTIRTMAALWGGVKIIMEIRTTRAESWGNQSILAACKQQLRDLDALALDSLRKLYIPTGYAYIPPQHCPTIDLLKISKTP